MRITTTMLNNTSRETGIPIGSSMLDYINQNKNSATLLDALNKKNTSAVNAAGKKSYEKIGDAADSLFKAAEGFLEEGEKNLFAKAKESGDYTDVYSGIAELAEHYNKTLKTLKEASGALNHYYSTMLSEEAVNNKDMLEKAGISISKDGKMTVDKEKLKAADKEQLEELFGKDSDFMEKLSFLSGRISDNAKAYTDSISNQYNAAGNIYSAMDGKYDFWG